MQKFKTLVSCIRLISFKNDVPRHNGPCYVAIPGKQIEFLDLKN